MNFLEWLQMDGDMEKRAMADMIKGSSFGLEKCNTFTAQCQALAGAFDLRCGEHDFTEFMIDMWKLPAEWRLYLCRLTARMSEYYEEMDRIGFFPD